LIKLLSGLYMPTQGSLTYNKLPIEQINKNIYRKKLAVVLQDFQLFSGSIKDNILMGREWIEESEIETALESSGTKNFLHMIPGGIESKLSDRGQSLSTGQRQSIALARALVGRPEILVLDESTSALDLNAEKDFLNNLDLSMLKTLILVTHRLPMLELVDRIIILADGAIALDGKKEDVLKQLRT
ncbi:MAG: ATP-binding cassette domain-containing protein, partial [Gammaproteobacteria bacterium]|nr:ATP-binding cassette domain-containing protein [Gammaproteobacteria bacterium]